MSATGQNLEVLVLETIANS